MSYWWRVRSLLLLFWLAGLFITLRLAYIHWGLGDALRAFESGRFEKKISLSPSRANIYDRNGKLLAFSVPAYSLYVDPKELDNKAYWVKKVAKVLGLRQRELEKKIKKSSSRFLWIKRQMLADEKEKLDSLKLPSAFGFIKEYRRIYPNREIASSLLGQVGIDGQGLSGIEYWIDRQFPRTRSVHRLLKDAKGRLLTVNEDIVADRLFETDVELTLDLDLQVQFEEQLRLAVEKHQAKAGMALLMDLTQSELLAASFVSRQESNFLRSPLFMDSFEFGSVVKPLVVAWALDKKHISPEFTASLEGGRWALQDRFIRESHYDPRWPSMNLDQIVAKSSNIGMAKIGLRMGDTALWQAFRSLGFGQRVGVQLSAESVGVLPAPPWRLHQIATSSFGQSWSATPIQMLQAWTALATDGQLLKPRLLKDIRNGEQSFTKEKEEGVGDKIFTTETVTRVRQALAQVVSAQGTGLRAQVEGYRVGGKTGTAQKPDPAGKGYKKGSYLSSFIGFLPLQQPRFLLLVAIDEPQESYYAADTAAPLFSSLMGYVLRKYPIPPDDPRALDLALNRRLKEGIGATEFTQGASAQGVSTAQYADDLQGSREFQNSLKLQLAELSINADVVRVRGIGSKIKTIVEKEEDDQKVVEIVTE